MFVGCFVLCVVWCVCGFVYLVGGCIVIGVGRSLFYVICSLFVPCLLLSVEVCSCWLLLVAWCLLLLVCCA